MTATSHAVQRHIEKPTRPIPRKYVEPILYLADRMSAQDRVVPAPSKRMADQLAEAVQMTDLHRQPWYREMDDERACELLNLDTVKRAALVVVSLVLKADTTRGEAAKGYFSTLRTRLEMAPIAVPTGLEQHRDLALRYLVG